MLCGCENFSNMCLSHFILNVSTKFAGNDSTADFLLSGDLNERDLTKLTGEELEDRKYSVASSNF